MASSTKFELLRDGMDLSGADPFPQQLKFGSQEKVDARVGRKLKGYETVIGMSAQLVPRRTRIVIRRSWCC
jgi:hypothetical protein